MLNLGAATPPRWAEHAARHLDEILLDHAHCERKAAGAALRLMFRYPDRAWLQAALAALAREELEHFEAVLARLEQRGVAFARQKPSPYGGRLHALIRAPEPERLVDTLLVSALIEARSCERFRCLAETLPDPDLAGWYRELLACEARHHHVYVELAERAGGGASLRERLGELAEAEARIVAEPVALARLHATPRP